MYLSAGLIAQDGTGGLFALNPINDIESSPVIYISSEGQAGYFAYNFNQAVSLIVSFPYWRDLLKFSGGGKESEMRKAFPLLKRELIEDNPGILSLIIKMNDTLSLEDIGDPVSYLYSAAHSLKSQFIKSKDGELFTSLFNTFVAGDNPYWKNSK